MPCTAPYLSPLSRNSHLYTFPSAKVSIDHLDVSVAAATHAIRRCSVYQDRRRAAVCGYVRSADRCAELELISGFLIAYPVQPWILKLVVFFGAISKSSLN